jgi:hypothetical protein
LVVVFAKTQTGWCDSPSKLANKLKLPISFFNL